jgi:hypothetical protein
LNIVFWGRCASRSWSRLVLKKEYIKWFPSLRSDWTSKTVKLNESENSIFSSFSQFFTVKSSLKPRKNTFLGPGIQKNMFLRILGNFNFFEKNRYKGPPCGQKNFFCSQHVQNMFFRLFNQFWVILVFSKNFDFSDHITYSLTVATHINIIDPKFFFLCNIQWPIQWIQTCILKCSSLPDRSGI